MHNCFQNTFTHYSSMWPNGQQGLLHFSLKESWLWDILLVGQPVWMHMWVTCHLWVHKRATIEGSRVHLMHVQAFPCVHEWEYLLWLFPSLSADLQAIQVAVKLAVKGWWKLSNIMECRLEGLPWEKENTQTDTSPPWTCGNIRVNLTLIAS